MTVELIVAALLTAGALAGAMYFIWRGVVHGLKREHIIVRGIAFTGKPARPWGVINILYSLLFIGLGYVSASALLEQLRR